MDTRKKAATLINLSFVLFVTISAYLIIKYAFAYMIPFLVSFAIVYILQTPSILLHKKFKIKKNIITLVLFLSILVFLGLIVWFISIKLIGLFGELLNGGLNIESIFTNICKAIDGFSDDIPMSLKGYVIFDSKIVVNEISQHISDFIMSMLEETLRYIPGIIFSTVISVVFAFFLAFDYDNIVCFIKRQLSSDSIKFVIRLKKIFNYSLFNLFKGYLIIMLFTFAEVCLGLTLIGIENSIAVSFIVAVVDMLPVFGTGVILIPWGVYLLISGQITRGICILILYVICAVVRYFAEPKIIGKKVGISPLVSLLTMFVGLKLFGISGLILLPFITSIILILNKSGYIKLWK